MHTQQEQGNFILNQLKGNLGNKLKNGLAIIDDSRSNQSMNSKSARSARSVRSASGARQGANTRNLIDHGDKTLDVN